MLISGHCIANVMPNIRVEDRCSHYRPPWQRRLVFVHPCCERSRPCLSHLIRKCLPDSEAFLNLFCWRHNVNFANWMALCKVMDDDFMFQFHHDVKLVAIDDIRILDTVTTCMSANKTSTRMLSGLSHVHADSVVSESAYLILRHLLFCWRNVHVSTLQWWWLCACWVCCSSTAVYQSAPSTSCAIWRNRRVAIVCSDIDVFFGLDHVDCVETCLGALFWVHVLNENELTSAHGNSY